MPFEIGDMVRPARARSRLRKKSHSVGIVVEVVKLPNYEDYCVYTVQFLTSDVRSVGWAEHTLERANDV